MVRLCPAIWPAFSNCHPNAHPGSFAGSNILTNSNSSSDAGADRDSHASPDSFSDSGANSFPNTLGVKPVPGTLYKCTACGKYFKVGYSAHAVDFASSVRGASRQEIIADYFEFNKDSFCELPDACPHCRKGGDYSERLNDFY